ncbi:TonB-dependent receptor [Exilibacterium tricleocarpae]|uniref:TonB-dependent receptor n=1 Tax=Exilibacterium tricleocarpae TaxID=2591008 RepID=A0A545U9U0_9GAMM|nr:TonB-dependent receptor [Exilibacterium tricleocarpae]TQV86244.1 TonB-dependent receptor [Exilibacterium tricleocarpae]
MNHYSYWLKTWACSLILVAMTIPPALGQIEAASLRGKIVFADTAKAGVEVVAVDIERGYTSTAITRADGSYIFVGMKPGRYRIYVGDAGAEQSETITLRIGQTASLDFDINAAPGGGMDEIVVVAERIENFQGGEVGTTITPEMMARLPQVTRNFLSFAELAPGVKFNQGADGSTSIRGGAQHQRGVNVFLDGVSQKDYVLKGGITGQDTSRGNPFPQSAVGEYKVITQNYKAEYDHVGSTAITAVTRSGTNEFHGDFFYDYTNQSLRSRTPVEEKTGEKVDSSQEQYGFTWSGPIIKDKLHFFASYERKNNEDPRDVIATTTAAPLPAELLALTGRKISEFEEDLFFGKLNWSIDQAQALEASIKYRDESETTGFGGVNTRSYGSSRDQEDVRVQVKHTYSTPSWQNEARITYEDSSWNPNPLTSGIGTVLHNSARQTILNLGAGRNFQDKGQEGWSLQNDFTFTDIEWHGSHVIKAGIKYKEITLKTVQLQPFNPQYYYNVEFNGPDTFALVQPYRVEWGVGVAGFDNRGAIESDNTQLGIYIQDDWYVTDRLTLNLGIRWDYEETPVYKDYVTPPDVVDALRNWENINNPNAGFDINDWISTGSNRDYFTGAWQPRLGFSYTLDSASRHTLFGGYGRSYDRNQFDFLQVEQTKGTFAARSFFFEGDPDNPCSGDTCVPWDPIYLTQEGLDSLLASTSGAGREINLLNNDLDVPYSDQFSLGVRSSWDSDWRTEVTLSRVESKNGFNWLLGNRREDGSFFAPGTIWQAPFGISPPGFSNLILSSNDLESRTNALFVKIERPHLDNWGFSLAYTYTDAEENWRYNGTFTLAYPSVDFHGWQDAIGVSDHRIIATGTYDLPWGIFLSGKLTLASTPPFQYTDCLDGPDQCFFDRIEPDDGEFRQLDVALSKEFAAGFGLFGDDSTFRIRLDILNLFDTRNWRSYDLTTGNRDNPNANFGRHRDELEGPSRTAKLSVGWSW